MKTTAKKPTAAQVAVINRVNNGEFPICFSCREETNYIHAWVRKTEGEKYIVVSTFRPGEYKAIGNAQHAGHLPQELWVCEDEITIDWEYSNCHWELHRAGYRPATEYLYTQGY